MSPVTDGEAYKLAQYFGEVARKVEFYRASKTDLKEPQDTALRNLYNECLDASRRFIIEAVGADLAKAQTSVGELESITGEARKAIAIIKTVDQVLKVAAAALGLALSIMAKDPSGIIASISEIKKVLFDELLEKVAALERTAPKLEMAEPQTTEEIKKLADTTKASLEAQKMAATQEIEIQKAKIDAIIKMFPKSVAQPREGKVDAKEIKHFGQLVANKALDQIAKDITAKDIITHLADEQSAVLIVPDLDFASGDVPWVEIDLQLKELTELIQKQNAENNDLLGIEEAAPLETFAVEALALAPVFLGAVADVLGFFKTDYQVEGYELTKNQEALELGVVRELRRDQKKVFLPNFYSLYNKKLPIIDRVNDLVAMVIELQTSKRLLTAKIESSPPETEKAKMQKALEASGVLESAVKTFSDAITAKPADQKYCKLVQAALREFIYEQLHITHLLCLKVLPGGGEAITKKGFFNFKTTNILYLGGVAVSYVLADLNGVILTANSLTYIAVHDCALNAPQTGYLGSPFPSRKR